MIVAMVVLIYVVVAWPLGAGLVRKQQWRELAAFVVFHSLALVLSVLYFLNLPLPSITKALQYVIKDVLHLTYGKT